MLALAGCAQIPPVASGDTKPAADLNGVPQELLNHLTRGVNVTRWFGYVNNPNDTNFYLNYFKTEDFANFQRLGVRFVRLSITPKVIYDNGQPKATALTYVDWALDWFKAADIAVIFDFHDGGELKLDAEGQDNSGFVTFWQAIAKHYQGQRENSLIFELMNEPVFRRNPEVWYALQEKTVQAIREIDPGRTLMVSGTGYSSADQLTKLRPLPEKNLIYTFHNYDPFLFTHQSATWASDNVKPLKHIPFPSSPEAVAKIIDELSVASQAEVRRYGESRYDADYLLKQLKKGADWGRQNHVPVLLGEFGSLPTVAPPDSRARWFAAMRAAIMELKLSNAIWAYDDAMGLGRKRQPDGTVWLDPVTLKNFYPDAAKPVARPVPEK